MSLLRDERGNWSSARCALWVTLIVSLLLAVLIVVSRPAGDLPDNITRLLVSTLLSLVSWAAGPRIAQYIGGQISGASAVVKSAVQRITANKAKDEPASARPADLVGDDAV